MSLHRYDDGNFFPGSGAPDEVRECGKLWGSVGGQASLEPGAATIWKAGQMQATPDCHRSSTSQLTLPFQKNARLDYAVHDLGQNFV